MAIAAGVKNADFKTATIVYVTPLGKRWNTGTGRSEADRARPHPCRTLDVAVRRQDSLRFASRMLRVNELGVRSAAIPIRGQAVAAASTGRIHTAVS